MTLQLKEKVKTLKNDQQNDKVMGNYKLNITKAKSK